MDLLVDQSELLEGDGAGVVFRDVVVVFQLLLCVRQEAG